MYVDLLSQEGYRLLRPGVAKELGHRYHEGTVGRTEDYPLSHPVLVTGAAGQIGGVGGTIVDKLLRRGLSVRALVHRDDHRAATLRSSGAEVVVADLTRAGDVFRALESCRRMYFGMSVSPPYLEATVAVAAAARQRGDLEVL